MGSPPSPPGQGEWETPLYGVSGFDAIEEIRERVEALEALLRERGGQEDGKMWTIHICPSSDSPYVCGCDSQVGEDCVGEYAVEVVPKLERGGQPPAEPSQRAWNAFIEVAGADRVVKAPDRFAEALKAAYAVDRPSHGVVHGERAAQAREEALSE